MPTDRASAWCVQMARWTYRDKHKHGSPECAGEGPLGPAESVLPLGFPLARGCERPDHGEPADDHGCPGQLPSLRIGVKLTHDVERDAGFGECVRDSKHLEQVALQFERQVHHVGRHSTESRVCEAPATAPIQVRLFSLGNDTVLT